MTSTSNGLPRTSRVLRRPDFEHAYSTGRRVHGRYMTVFLTATDRASSRLGVAASRKIGPATVRNRAKRLVRELFRRHKLAVGLDIIVVPRREMLDAPFTNLENDYLSILVRRDHGRSGGEGARRRRRGTASVARV